jgi:hypothetical protein
MKKMYQNEEWKPFLLGDCDHSIEKFWVSNYGRVKRQKPKHKKPKLSNFVHAGVFQMFFFYKKGGKAATYYVHRAVAGLFCEKPKGAKFVIHLDHDSKNNHADNLKWVNRSGLSKHQRSNPKRIATLQNKKSYKLNPEKVRLMKRVIFDPNRQTRIKLIAEQFGVSKMQVYRIKNGQNWSNVDY